MSYSVEKALADARCLVNRLKDRDTSVDTLISQAQSLNKRVESMKHYQDDLNELNEVARHKPKSAVIMNLLQENTQIRELQQENRDLRMALEEHQSAVELIMSKYREHIVKLLLANKLDKKTPETDSKNKLLEEKIDRVNEMIAVMQQAISIDDRQQARDLQLMTQLKLENNTLREVLHIAVSQGNLYKPPTSDFQAQTDSDCVDTSLDEDSLHMFKSVDLMSSVITVKELEVNTTVGVTGSTSSASPRSPDVSIKTDSKESSPESVTETPQKTEKSQSPPKK